MSTEFKDNLEREANYIKLVLAEVDKEMSLADAAEHAAGGKGYCHLSDVVAKLALEIKRIKKAIKRIEKKVVDDE